jgi:putative nucleotidyltransferase with HDIG domain
MSKAATMEGRNPRASGGNRAPMPSRPRGERQTGAGGRRLADAFEIVSELPALAEARGRVLRLADREGASIGEVAAAIESDTALAIAIMRAANNGDGPPGRVTGVRQAVEALTAPRVGSLASAVDTYDPYTSPGEPSERFERFRRHAVATRHAADRIAELARLTARDELAVAALLHDIGRLVVAELYPEFEPFDERVETPEARLRQERREIGVDHALVGAVLVRRWGIRAEIAAAIERHHADDGPELAAAVRLADLIAHFAAGDKVSREGLDTAARALELRDEQLRGLLYEFPHEGEGQRRVPDPCPLSLREIDALRGLAEGKVYKQIAQELTLSVSTVRTHLHNVYRKIGAVDRAQAVLIARDRGWL